MKSIVAGQTPVTAAEFADTALGDYYDAGSAALHDIREMIESEGDEIDRASLPYYDQLIADLEQDRVRRVYYNTLVRKSPLPRRAPRSPRRVADHRPKSERRPTAPAASTRPAVRFSLRGRSA